MKKSIFITFWYLNSVSFAMQGNEPLEEEAISIPSITPSLQAAPVQELASAPVSPSSTGNSFAPPSTSPQPIIDYSTGTQVCEEGEGQGKVWNDPSQEWYVKFGGKTCCRCFYAPEDKYFDFKAVCDKQIEVKPWLASCKGNWNYTEMPVEYLYDPLLSPGRLPAPQEDKLCTELVYSFAGHGDFDERVFKRWVNFAVGMFNECDDVNKIMMDSFACRLVHDEHEALEWFKGATEFLPPGKKLIIRANKQFGVGSGDGTVTGQTPYLFKAHTNNSKNGCTKCKMKIPTCESLDIAPACLGEGGTILKCKNKDLKNEFRMCCPIADQGFAWWQRKKVEGFGASCELPVENTCDQYIGKKCRTDSDAPIKCNSAGLPGEIKCRKTNLVYLYGIYDGSYRTFDGGF